MLSATLLDPARLDALHAAALLDQSAVRALDRLTRLAARLLGTPAAVVSLVEPHRQYFASATGLPEPWAQWRETPLSHSFCQHVVASGEPLIVNDAPRHPLVCDNLAITELGVVAYLGVPLRDRDGHVLGSFCVIDTTARTWTPGDLETLLDLSQLATAEIELRAVRTALDTATQSHDALLTVTTELVCEADANGRITHVNQAWCTAFGYSLAEARGLYVPDLVAPEDRGRFLAVVEQLRAGAAIQALEVSAVRRDGQRVICRGNAVGTVVPDANSSSGSRFVGSHAVYRDVSAERRNDAARARLVSALESTSEFVGIASADGRIEYLNRAGRTLLGLTDDVDLTSLRADHFHTPATMAELAAEGFPTAMRDGSWRGDGHVVASDGAIIPVAMTITTHPSIVPGDLPYFSAIMRDQRDREEATAILRASEAQLAHERAFLAATLESLSDGVVACDAAGNLALFNRATRILHGLPEEPLRPDEWASRYNLYAADGTTPLTLEQIPLVRALRGEEVVDAPMVIAPVNGPARTISAAGRPIRAADGTCLGAVVAMRDVTERMQAERALRDSEARFRVALAGGGFAYAALEVVRDSDGVAVDLVYTDVNSTCEELWGVAAAQLRGARFADVWSTPLEGGLLRVCLEVYASGTARALDCEAPDPLFEAEWLSLHIVPLAQGVALLARDISAPKRAERELRLLVDVTHQLTQSTDLASATTAALASMATAIGWAYAEAWVRPTAGAWEALPADDADRLELGPTWAAADDSRLARFAAASRTTRFGRGEGLPGRAWAAQAPLFYPALDAPGVDFPRLRLAVSAGLRSGFAIPVVADGEVIAVLAFYTRDWKRVHQSDVTLLAAVGEQVGAAMRRKMAEDTLERERCFLSTVLDSLSENVSVCDPNGRLVLFNRATSETHGREAEPHLSAGEWSTEYGVFLPDGHTPFPFESLPHVQVNRTESDVVGVEFMVKTEGNAPRIMVANAHVLRGPSGEVRGSVCAARDMTAERTAQAAHRELEQRLSLIYNNVSDLLFLTTVERDEADRVTGFRCESVNARLLTATGQSAEHFVGQPIEEIVSPEHRALVLANYYTAVETGSVQQLEYDAVTPAGRLVVEVTLTPVCDTEGRPTHVLGSNRDVTARREAEAALRESEVAFRAMLETVRALAVMMDVQGRVTFVNEAVLSTTGWTRGDVLGQDWFARFVPEATTMRRLFQDMIDGGEYIPHAENEILTRTGGRRLVVWDNTVLRNAAGDIVGTASIGQDVTGQRYMEAQLAAMSERDDLTGLLNRRGFGQQIDYGIRAARRARRPDVLVCIDLDRFKPINDTYGHAEGDKALRAVADLLAATVRDTDHIGRLGGDEFAIYAVGDPDSGDGTALVERLFEALRVHNQQATRDGRPYEIGFSVGLTAVAPDDTRDVLLARADAALYAVKHAR